MWPVQKVLINLFCVLSFVLIYLSNLVLVRIILCQFHTLSVLYLHFVFFVVCCFFTLVFILVISCNVVFLGLFAICFLIVVFCIYTFAYYCKY